MGIEPTLAAWEAAVLPLNYTRLRALILFSFRWVQQPRHFLRRAQLRAGCDGDRSAHMDGDLQRAQL
jgi:hypothetical protein